MHDNYSKMETEKTNPRTQQIDLCGTEEMVAMINREDALVADAVREAIPQIARAVDCMFETLKNGGHVLYVERELPEGWACWTRRNACRRSALEAT